MFVLDISKQVIRVHEMIAGIEVTIVLQGEPGPASFIKDTHTGGIHAQPIPQGGFKGLHKDTAHVATNPFIKNG